MPTILPPPVSVPPPLPRARDAEPDVDALQISTTPPKAPGVGMDLDDWMLERETPVMPPRDTAVIPSFAPVALDDPPEDGGAVTRVRSTYLVLGAVSLALVAGAVGIASVEGSSIGTVRVAAARESHLTTPTPTPAELAAEPGGEARPAPTVDEATFGAMDLDGAFFEMTDPTIPWRDCLASEPSGSAARVMVTFAPSGRSGEAWIEGAPLAGTATGACIASSFVGLRVNPFAGPAQTVSMTVVKPWIATPE